MENHTLRKYEEEEDFYGEIEGLLVFYNLDTWVGTNFYFKPLPTLKESYKATMNLVLMIL